MSDERKKLPDGWTTAKVDELCTLNPKHDQTLLEDLEVSFIPMASVDDERGEITEHQLRRLGDVRKGYTHFADDDVIWAKITPCMENGKAALAKGLKNGLACGSTEFFVLRSNGAILPALLYQYIRQENFRYRAKAKMTSAAGHARVPKDFLLQEELPVAPLNEQKRIVAQLGEFQARSNRAREVLESIPDLLEQFRKSILAAAFRGDLTKEWRKKNPDVESAAELLKRIRAERRKRWEEAELEKFKAKGFIGDKLNEEFAKRRKNYKEPAPVDISGLPQLPESWCWAMWSEVGFCQNGRAFPSKYYSSEGIKLLRPGNLHVTGQIEWTTENTRHMPEEWMERYQDYVIGPGELIVNLTAQSLKDEFLGRVCLTCSNERCLLNQRLARLSPVSLSGAFCLWLFKSPIFRRYVDTLNTGSLIQHMFTTQVEQFVFPLPPEREQELIVQRISEMFDGRENLAQTIAFAKRQLESLDQAILAKAFRGELMPQDPNDEPASFLLERIRREKALQVPTKRKKDKQRDKKNMTSKDFKQRDVLSVLREANRAMTPEEVFAAGGFDEESVDAFYVQLRNAIAAKEVREIRTDDSVSLEAIRT